jgi:hypothetical protein
MIRQSVFDITRSIVPHSDGALELPESSLVEDKTFVESSLAVGDIAHCIKKSPSPESSLLDEIRELPAPPSTYFIV